MSNLTLICGAQHMREGLRGAYVALFCALPAVGVWDAVMYGRVLEPPLVRMAAKPGYLS